MSVEIDKAIDYRQPIVSHSDINWLYVFPTTPPTIQITSSQTQSLFELPSTVFNLSKSYLQYNLTYSDSNAGSSGQYAYINTMPITHIEQFNVQSKEGVFLCQNQSNSEYLRTVLPCLIPLEEFRTLDESLGTFGTSATIANSQVADKGENLFKSNTISNIQNSPYSPSAQGLNSGRISSSTYTSSSSQSGTIEPVSESPLISYTEYQYYKECALGSGAGAGTNITNYSMSLKHLAPHTICSIDQDIYLNQNSYINVYWSPISQFGWQSTNSGSTGRIGQSATPLSGSMQVNNLRLVLAVNKNETMVPKLINQVQTKGMDLIIPFLTTYVYSTPSANQFNHLQKLNISLGGSLLAIYAAVYSSNTQTGLTFYDVNNNNPPSVGVVGGYMAKVQNGTNVQVNSQNFYPFGLLNEAQNELWDVSKDMLKGTVIGQCSNTFNANRVLIVSYREGPCIDWLASDQKRDGRSLVSEMTFSIGYNVSTAAYRSFFFVITQRVLSVMPGGLIQLH